MILVTGGTGLTGSHLLLYLTRKGLKVRAIFRSEKSMNKTKNLFKYYSAEPEKLWANIEWIPTDITDITALKPAFEAVTRVYHTAAKVSFLPKDKDVLMQTNVDGTANLLHLAIDNKIQKFLHVSSIAALGGYDNPITEKTHWNWKETHSDYAVSKYLSEMEVWRAGQEGLPIVIINPAVILGAHFWDTGTGQIVQKVDNGLRFYPPGGNAFVDVWDVVKIMTELMQRDISNESFIVSGFNQTYFEFLSSLAKFLGKKPPQTKLPYWLAQILYVAGRLTGKGITSKAILKTLFQHPQYSSQKLVNTLEYQFIPFEASIRNLTTQYRKVFKK